MAKKANHTSSISSNAYEAILESQKLILKCLTEIKEMVKPKEAESVLLADLLLKDLPTLFDKKFEEERQKSNTISIPRQYLMVKPLPGVPAHLTRKKK